MWVFFDSYEGTGLNSVKIIAGSKEELLIEIGKYSLKHSLDTCCFEIGKIKNNKITKETI
ncbi:hypothetical protein [Enterococcus wangshanyuanii]|uniref:Uncharacterized protein n=1 Tax=Enterococcus wangshanyuanii TaxID=2005703 RepID=A0ABQ1NI39_9ENTE|nr:hypothetical protein [Enterococcus wangshanyuanii]GGC74828.1 hypothetical protein GCM10011573_00450 [Enterococcus wangshanyuanii]